jgi:hypothetical protein
MFSLSREKDVHLKGQCLSFCPLKVNQEDTSSAVHLCAEQEQ